MSIQAMTIEPATGAPTSGGQALGQGAGVAGGVYTARLHTSLETVMPLWLRCQAEGVCSAHQSYAWAEGIAKRLMPEGAELIVVEVTDAGTGELKMLMPLMRSSRFGYRVIEWLSCGVCDYSAPLLADSSPWTRQAAEAAWAAIRSVLPPADRIHITGIPREIYGVANPLAMLASAGDSSLITSGLVLAGDPETLIKRHGRPSFVKTFNKDWRRLERHGSVDLVEANTPGLVELIFGALVEMRLRRFRQLGRFDLLAQPAVVDFYRNAALQGLSDGSVRVFGLRAGEDWVAGQYLLTRQGTLHALLIGIDQEVVVNASPGLAIIGRLMEWGLRQGFNYFDLSVGSQPYKEQFGAESSVLATLDETLTPLGKGVAAVAALRERVELFVRSNPRLSKAGQRLVRGLRRLKN
ncbi:GNAT family N-acetyltransferase [Mesorhizobium qingshengii]|uniref:Acetyltransferase involved in cellulose biosynthesis, CelD/BcsL family n=1 Tax=Mesorhizobium qingshengii TaxID=1165689 RepID=A0A1G5ZRW7_9HYPH|nr:GNAT family N-acetyltransferase [Mesorhizobium qingshengii]SDA97551.1 Acetyltransferase involved in cellulose biosynthesis, CelD/BcsL family [Mesorhizobium qingshengii]